MALAEAGAAAVPAGTNSAESPHPFDEEVTGSYAAEADTAAA